MMWLTVSDSLFKHCAKLNLLVKTPQRLNYVMCIVILFILSQLFGGC